MKLLMIEDSVQLSKNEAIVIILVVLFIWIMGYITGAEVTRMCEKTTVMQTASSHQHLKTVVARSPKGQELMKWLEIPAHRVLEVECQELEDEFDMYDDEGKLCGGSSVYLLFRRKDGKRFKFAKFGDIYGAIKRNRAYLQEV